MPDTIVRVDTVIVTKEVAPPLPDATEAELCLSTGFPARIWITPAGDTLVAERKISLRELRPGVAFEGVYAEGRAWLRAAQPIRFERRDYTRTGAPGTQDCAGLKNVGMYDGIPLFADLLATSPLETILVPVRPGIFQAFRTRLRR